MPAHRYGSEREALGAQLRELRTREGLSGTALAMRLGWAQSKVSRLERGNQTPSEADILAWAAALGADETTVESLRTKLRTARAEYGTWRQGLDAGQVNAQEELVTLGKEAATVRNLEVALIPGLLQTAEYARYRLLENVEVHNAPRGNVDKAVSARMLRQEQLYNPDKHFEFIVTESALRAMLCPLPVMLGQLDRLLAIAGSDNVRLTIIPLTARLPVAPLHGFAIFGDIVLVETYAGEIILRGEDDLTYYNRIFDHLRSVGYENGEARLLIQQALADLRQTQKD